MFMAALSSGDEYQRMGLLLPKVSESSIYLSSRGVPGKYVYTVLGPNGTYSEYLTPSAIFSQGSISTLSETYNEPSVPLSFPNSTLEVRDFSPKGNTVPRSSLFNKKPAPYSKACLPRVW